MEHYDSAAEQKCNREREKNILHRKAISEPSPGSRLFSDQDGSGHTELEGRPRGASGNNSTSSGHKYLPGKPESSVVCQSSQHNTCPRVSLHSYPQKFAHSYPQQLMQDSVLPGGKPQHSLETHAWPLKCTPSNDTFLEETHSQGVFPQQKSSSSHVVFVQYSQPGSEQYEEMHKKELKPKKTGKYICNYCGRACAKPSVLKKHIRSHTGERPYPCGPCGFSFKTKSNLYKHRKSHAHAIKAGLVPFSEQAATRADTDLASSVGETDIHSDGEQSTDTDEETTECLLFQDNNCQIPQVTFRTESSTIKKFGQPVYVDSAEELSVASMKVPILIIPKQGIPSGAMDCTNAQICEGDESHAIKQRLALRLTEKNDQGSEQSLNLLSPHSKGSTDSGYFSRSESAEQQISPPNTNVKSYEEIMFGRTWYKPSRQKQSITQGIVAGQDSDAIIMNEPNAMLDMGIRTLEHRFLRGDSTNLQRLSTCDAKVCTLDPHGNSCLLEPPSDSGPLMRSNSMPTSSLTNLTVPPNLRGSHSFDEMITQDDVFYPGAAGLRRLRRQAAFEHSVHEGHADSENSSILTKITVPPLKFWDRGNVIQDFRTLGKDGISPEREKHPFVPHSYTVGVVESTTRKRRIEKSVGDEEDSGGHDESSKTVYVDIVGDYDPNMGHDASRSTSTEKGAIFSSQSQSDSLENGDHPGSEDLVVVPDIDRKTTGNVISVIQHTNSLSRPSSFDRSESTDLPAYQDKPTRKLSEHSDIDHFEDGKSPEFVVRSENMEQQQQSDHELAGFSEHQRFNMPHKLVRQPNIQVPEIRVTEEPEKPDREPEAATKEPEKQPMEEFQWPQRSETLSQLPAEKLPPKKKRLRLADMEYSSGESSFESTCTSLSRSPSQDSNLSHSSSFSMSFDKEESLKCMSPTKLDDVCKQSDFLTVPGHTLSLPSHHHKEMRRSSSEQAPCTLPAEIPENRSKSFDYGSLSPSSKQGELYASPSSSKQQRRGYLVRQASLSVYPETVLQEQNLDLSMKKEHSDIACISSLGWQSGSLTTFYGTTTGEESKSKRLQDSSDHEHFTKELTHQEATHHSLSQHWDNYPTQKQEHCLSYSKHHLPAIHIRHHSLLPDQQQCPQTLHLEQSDKEKDRDCSQSYCQPRHLYSLSSKKTSTSSAALPVVSDSSFPGMLVPVRIPTHVPSYSSIMYTSVSEILPTHAQCTASRVISIEKSLPISLTGIASKRESGLHLSHIFGHPDVSLQYPVLKIPEALSGRLNTGIPLSLTSGTVTTTDSSSAIGASKRMLSPANSLELFIETKQQKLVKEERMYGQIVKELSAVELSNTGASKSKSVCLSKNDTTEQEKINLPLACKFSVTKGSGNLTALQQGIEALTPPLPISPDIQDRTLSVKQLDVDGSAPDPPCFQKTLMSRDTSVERKQDMGNKPPVNMLVQFVANQGGGGPGCTFLLTDLSDAQQFFQFPTLRTTTSVSWCFLNYTKPNHSQTTPISSVYGSWCVSSYNPNPLSLSTKATLALLCSRQSKNTETYTTAAMHQPGSGKLVPSLLWKQRFSQVQCVQLKSEVMQIDSRKYSHQEKNLSPRENESDRGEKDPILKKVEPARIKIFEGGYKSNEDYVYVRGRGRGKYICEECGIRCKKPSMLKKHIRTHTDVRPYICKFCNFAFKTKGNLTKHMKSKAHMKKCLELGVSVTSIDGETEEADAVEDNPRDPGQAALADHQFSDADDSEGQEDDGDEIDDDEEDEEEYDGDSTPKTCSRSTSPQPSSLAVLATTVVTASQGCATDFVLPGCKPSLFSFLTSQPIIQVAQLKSCEHMGESAPMQEYQSLLYGTLAANHRNHLSVQSFMDEDFSLSSENISPSSPSCLSSYGYESSPLREPSPTSQRYLSLRGDLSPRRHLSSRREAQHLQHLSPRRDFFRRDVSPRGDRSPTNLLLPISNMGRPTSPGCELSSRRDLSPRSRYKMRPVSPRRGLHHHSASWNQGQNLQAEVANLTQKARSPPETETEHSQKLDCGRNSSCTGTDTSSHGLFSHLPLHSQQQIHTPFPMIPIGGIQIVQSTRPSITGLIPPAQLPLQSNTLEKSSATGMIFQEANGQKLPSGRYFMQSPQTQRKREEQYQSMLSEKFGKISSEMSSDKDNQQEESIQICTKAIASLRIASEELIDKSLVHDSSLHQHPPTPSHSPSNPEKNCTNQDSSVK